MPGAPVPPRAPISQFVDAEQYAVRWCLQPLGHSDVQIDRTRLGGWEIEAGPEQVAAFALHGSRDPRQSRRRLGPDKAAVPGRAHRDMRSAAIADFRYDFAIRRYRCGQGDAQSAFGIGPGRSRQRLAIDRDGADGQIAIEIDHQAGQRRLGGKIEYRDTSDRLGGGHHFDRQVDGIELQFRLLRVDRTARPLRLRRQRRQSLWRRRRSDQCDERDGKQRANEHVGLSSQGQCNSTMSRSMTSVKKGTPFCAMRRRLGQFKPWAAMAPSKVKRSWMTSPPSGAKTV